MAKKLDVYFHEKNVGELEQDNHGEMSLRSSNTDQCKMPEFCCFNEKMKDACG